MYCFISLMKLLQEKLIILLSFMKTIIFRSSQGCVAQEKLILFLVLKEHYSLILYKQMQLFENEYSFLLFLSGYNYLAMIFL